MDAESRETRAGYALVVLSAVSFGSLAVLAKLAYAEGLSVTDVLFWRFSLCALAVAPIAFAWGRRAEGALPARGRRGVAALAGAFALGAVGYTSTTLLYFSALKTLPAGISSFLLYLAPVFVAVGAAALFRERLGGRGLAALALATGGLALMTLGPEERLDARGLLLAVASAATYAGTILAGREVVRSLSPARLTVAMSAGAATAMVLVSGGEIAIPGDAYAWGLALAIAIVCTGVAVVTFYMGLARIGAQRTSIVSTLEPVCTVAFGAVLLAERLSLVQALGGAAVLAGTVVLATASQASRRAE